MTFITPDRTIITIPFSVVNLECGGYRVTDKGGSFEGYYDQQRKLHRNDGPAFTYYNRNEVYWYRHGVIHCDTGPAVRYRDALSWFVDGKLHRIDGPARQTEHSDVWFQNGLIHRKDGPAKINRLLNIEEWYWYGRLHREDGPARTTRTLTEWYRRGHLHRTDGPAVIHKNGSMEWRYRGGFHRTDGPCFVGPTGKPVLWGYYGKRFMRMTDYLAHAKLAESAKTELMLIYGV